MCEKGKNILNIERILNRIEALPPLPKTIVEIEKYRIKKDKEIDELQKIVEKDALIVANLLKIANSAMFGFRSRVETPKRAISLLGINFTVSVAISTSSQKLLLTSLGAYGYSNDEFMDASNMASVLASLWLNTYETELKDEIVLASLLQEVGKFIISDSLKYEKKDKDFRALVEEGEYSVESIERNFLGFTSSFVAAQVFKHWKLSANLINSIEFVDDIQNVAKGFEKRAKILSTIKTICNIKEPLSDESIKKGLEKVKLYNLDMITLQRAISTLKTRLEKKQLES